MVRNRIPVEEYGLSPSGYTYITNEILEKHHNKNEVAKFNEWMRGQTCGLIDGKPAIYSWDYERWLGQGRQIEQGPDWDWSIRTKELKWGIEIN
jgi:hypothetical protein